MNGQLSHQQLAELIREISAKSQSGSVRLERERVKVVAYFYKGHFVYAACNVRTFRLREYLLKSATLPPEQLANYDERAPDLQLARLLSAQQSVTPEKLKEIQSKQVSDILRLALSWTDGVWEFDQRSLLDETVDLNVDVEALLVEVERKKSDSSADQPQPAEAEATQENAEAFLERMRRAETYYDILGVESSAGPVELKSAYYDLARRYHPDRFRKSEPALLTRLESAFARITQAYDTLLDDQLRANYNAKLLARRKAQQIADATAKPTAPEVKPVEATPDVPVVPVAERAANDFKEALAALEQGQRSLAAGLFASATRLAPNEPRYHAFFGQLLASQANTQRAAEAELQAAIRLDPGNADYRVMLAQLFRDLGFALRAKGEAERAVAADPNNRKARDLLRELKGV
ncbi:MAG TPA: DnaJ domain-containing protein [Pyrinomonadaceae bacterium]|nr:DnaJ domain-containing protein [Pyrinomonadaceae bacterium]